MKRYFLAALALLTLGAVAVFAGQAQTASAKPAAGSFVGTGATFPFPLISKWIPAVDQSATGSRSLTRRPGRAPASRRSRLARSTSAHPTRRSARTSSRPARAAWSSRGRWPACPFHTTSRVSASDCIFNGRSPRQHLPREHHELERCRDPGVESGSELARPEDHGCVPLRRIGLDVRLHELSLGSQPAMEEQGRQSTRASTSRSARVRAEAPASPAS